jgi:hypothetical protein
MAHAFKVIPAKPTFGTVRPLFYQDDYLAAKKRAVLFANAQSNINTNSRYSKDTFDYETYYLLRYNTLPRSEVNRSNLIYNLYSQENLTSVNSVARNTNLLVPATINSTNTPFYNYYSIDPIGQLFGRSQCGELNYVNYMQPDYCLQRPIDGNLDEYQLDV